jgi:class 3 adenylate cyclase
LVDLLGEAGIPIRAGLHAGEIKIRGDDVAGMVIHTAARVMDHAKAGEILITRLLADLTADQNIAFETCGAHQLKGLSEETELLRVQKLRPVSDEFSGS